jgi:hypothetical protein
VKRVICAGQPESARETAPVTSELFLFRRRFGGKFLWKRIAGTLLVPQDAHDPPAIAVTEQLNAVDAAGEGRLSGSVPGFIAAEDL